MKPPFQYPRRAEADNFRTKVKLVRSAFRSPRSIAVGSHQPRRGPASLVNGFSSAATDHLTDFGVRKFRTTSSVMALSPDFYADCAVGTVAVRARRSYKNGGFHSDPIAADGFAVDSFTDTRAAPLSSTRRKCWLSCDRKWWEPYRTCGRWSLHLILPPRLS